MVRNDRRGSAAPRELDALLDSVASGGATDGSSKQPPRRRDRFRRDAAAKAANLSRPVRSRFETLRADGILERRYRVYRVSHIALYSSFRVDSAPDPRTDKRVIRSTATK